METIVSLAIQVALIFPAAPYYPNSPCFVYESQTVTQGRDCTRVFQDVFFKTSVIFQHKYDMQEELHFAPYLKEKNDFL